MTVTLKSFLVDFVEDRDTSRDSAERAEPLAFALAEQDGRFEALATALATYDVARIATEAGMYDIPALKTVCRDALHDLGEHRHCFHD